MLPRATSSMESAMTSRRDERGLHAFGAHGDAVGDGDGVELHGRAAGLADALLDGLGDLAEMEVAGADLGPGVGDADDGLVQVFFAEANTAQGRSVLRRGMGPSVRTLECFLGSISLAILPLSKTGRGLREINTD